MWSGWKLDFYAFLCGNSAPTQTKQRRLYAAARLWQEHFDDADNVAITWLVAVAAARSSAGSVACGMLSERLYLQRSHSAT